MRRFIVSVVLVAMACACGLTGCDSKPTKPLQTERPKVPTPGQEGGGTSPAQPKAE